MAENKDTYVLTIENDAINTTITSVQKNNELLQNNLNINLDDVDRASADLKNVINPAITPAADNLPEAVAEEASAAVAEEASEASEAEEASEASEAVAEEASAAVEPLNMELVLKNANDKVKFAGNSNELIDQVRDSNTLLQDKKQNLINTINKIVNSSDTDIMKTSNINQLFRTRPEARFQDNKLLGGTHHTIKRRHNRRNIKSTTRKGQLYRKNHRRTHGRKAGNGKKQTRRILNH